MISGLNVLTLNKEWLEFFSKTADKLGNPLIILDESQEIVFTNQNAVSNFLIDDQNVNLDQVFESDTVIELNDLIGLSVNTSAKLIERNISLKLKTGTAEDFELVLETISSEYGVNTILFFTRKEEISEDHTGIIKTSVSVEKLKIFYPEIKDLADAISSNLPLTILSLKNVQKVIDDFSEPVWIKTPDDKLICVNDTFADNLDVEKSFAVGKKHEMFLPLHKQLSIQLVNQFVSQNKKPVILEGFIRKDTNFKVSQNLLQIPILDRNRKINYILGLIVDNKTEYSGIGKLTDFFREIIENFKDPLAIADFKGNFKICNQKFLEIADKNSKEILNKKFSDLFSEDSVEKFLSFIESELTDLTVETLLFDDKQNAEKKYKLYFCKQVSKLNSEKVVLITLELINNEKNYDDGIEFILTKRGKMFDILIQKNPEPVLIYDKENLKFLEVNEAAVNLYGYTRDEFLQMDLTDLYSPEDIQTLLDSSGDDTSTASFSRPFRHRKKDGTIILVKISKTSFIYNDREAHFNIVNDITDSIEKDKQNQMLRAIFAQSDLIVLTTDAAGFITYANQNSVKTFGYTADELLRSSFASLVIDEERALINTSIFQYHIKDAIELETTIKSSDGRVIECYLSAYPIMDFEGETDSFTLILKPKSILSEPKEIIKEVVKEIAVEKPVEVDKRTVILDSNFLSGMFHEILTPINVIIGFSQELISSTESPTEEQKEAAEIINQNRIKMMDTMNSVVEYSDILQNRAPLKVDDINITEIIEKLDENIQNISGINDIQFLYGKISSSLKFKSDLHKFESFVLTVIKVVSRLSKDKKVYFSAFPLDNDTFLIGLSDQYGNPSEYVANVLEQVFENNRDPKDFGLPKLTTYLSRVLLDYLGGRFYRSSAQTLRPETGFIFNLTLSSKNKFDTVRIQPDVVTDKNVAADLEQVSEEIEQSEEVDLTAEQEISATDEDIFKPVAPISQEILSKLSEDILDENITDEKITDEEVVTSFEQDEPLDVKTETADKSDQLPEQESMIPKQEVKEEIPDAVPVKSLDLSKLNCLYIEDQIDSQLLFKVQLKELRDVKFAVSFEEAQLLLFNHQFDFIVMDINLQGEYNGLDALKIIKAMPAFSSIPIIAVTAYVLPGDKEKFIAAGFDDFISKPIFREKMIASLEKIFLSK